MACDHPEIPVTMADGSVDRVPTCRLQGAEFNESGRCTHLDPRCDGT